MRKHNPYSHNPAQPEPKGFRVHHLRVTITNRYLRVLGVPGYIVDYYFITSQIRHMLCRI